MSCIQIYWIHWFNFIGYDIRFFVIKCFKGLSIYLASLYMVAVVLPLNIKNWNLTLPKYLQNQGQCEQSIIWFVNSENFCKNLGLAVLKKV